ncbi:helix-turn-helix domain-containing protein [Streptomyces polygonati]|uniref:Helix-turn-helix domain-containing protein n=1 Tax=Streptomyces polygonati TaxID=1617087 RepID=A0ABV8HML8_9ACTN
MAAQESPRDASDTSSSGSPDLRQRVAGYCEQRGMTLEDVARRAGMAPTYLRQLEEMESDFDPEALHKVAVALDITYEELMEGRADSPRGQNPPARTPRLAKLNTEECRARLGHHGVGRVALPGEYGTVILPVNYLVDGADVVYRTARGGAADPDPGSDITFEVDRLSDRASDGWSVLVFGRAEILTDPDMIQDYLDRPGAQPWAGGSRDQWVRIVADRLTGRLIQTGG